MCSSDLPAITVEVSHADAGTEFFPVNRDAIIALVMGKLNAGLYSDICKLYGRRMGRLCLEDWNKLQRARCQHHDSAQEKKEAAAPREARLDSGHQRLVGLLRFRL